jgi:hypothetical protein
MMERYEFLGIKVPGSMLAELKRRAKKDDRPLSAYVRRLLVNALHRQQPNA